MSRKTEINTERYSQDKPKSCEFCYFWRGKRYGCELKQCYYLLPQTQESSSVHNGDSCEGCPYGKQSPCIGYCLVKNMQELKVGRYAT